MIVQFLSGSSVCQPHLLRWSQMIWASEIDAMISLQKNMEAGSDSASAIKRLDSRHTACTGDVTYCEGLPFCIMCRSLKYCYLREACNITTVILMLMWCFFPLQINKLTRKMPPVSLVWKKKMHISIVIPETWTCMTVNIRKSVC